MTQRGFVYESVGPSSVEATTSVVMPRESEASTNRILQSSTDRWLLDRPLSRTMTAECNLSSRPADRRRAAGADGRAARAQCRGAGRAAGRRQDHARAAGARATSRGRRTEDHRAGAAPARRPRRRRAHGGDARRGGRRDRRLSRALRLQGVAQDPHRGRHRRRVHAAWSSTIPRSTASRRCCSTNSTSARSMPISAWRWRSTCSAGLRDDLRLLVMSATHRRRAGGEAARRCAGDRERGPRLSGRDALSRPRRARADRAAGGRRGRARAARRAGLGAGVPARRRRKSAAPRRCCKERIGDPAVDVVALLRRARCADVQDRAIAPAPPGRRKVVLATSIAETSLTIEGVRIVIDCGLARVPRYEPDVGLTRLETVRVSRAAADQRRGRAGRTEPGVCYRLWDEPQTASLAPSERAGNPRRRSVEPGARSRALGRRPIRQARLPRSAAARGLVGGARAAHRARRDRRRRPHHRRGPGAAAIAAAAAARAHGGRCGARRARRTLAAEIAAVLTERGLGGNDVDLAHRLDDCAATVRAAPGRARGMAKRWAQIAQAVRPPEGQGWRASDLGARRACCSRSPIPTASPGAAARRGSFLLQRARRAMSIRRRRWRASRFSRSREIAGTAAQGRILLAAPLTLAEIEAHFGGPHRERATRSPSMQRPRACARRRLRRLGAVTLGEQVRKVEPDDETARLLAEGIARLGIDRLPWSKALRQWRDRVMFLRRAEGDEWPDLSDAALAATRRRVARAALAGKTALAALGADEFADAAARRCCRGICAAGSTPRRRRISRRRPARRCRSTTRRRRGRSSPSACRSCSASTGIRRSPAGGCRWWSNCSRPRTGRCR